MNLNPSRSFSTNDIVGMTRRDMNQFVPYDIPDLVHMKNVIDVGPGYGQLTKDQQKIVIPSMTSMSQIIRLWSALSSPHLIHYSSSSQDCPSEHQRRCRSTTGSVTT